MESKTPEAARLRAARKRVYRTMQAACAANGWTYPTYVGHENGQRAYSIEDARIYAAAFHTTPEALLFGDADRRQPVAPAPAAQQPVSRPPGFTEEGARPFIYDAGKHPPMQPLAPTQQLYEVTARELSERGLVPGQKIVVEPLSDWAAVQDSQSVLVTINGELHLRVFLAPNILVTTSSGPLTATRTHEHNTQLIGRVVRNFGW